MNWFERLRAHTVFNPFKIDWQSNEIIAIVFHRAAAILYFIYSIWGVTAISNNIPSIVQAQGDFGATIFGFFLLVCAAPACVGATFFPRLGRLEMFSEAAFIALILIYVSILVYSSIIGNPAALVQAIAITSFTVVPVARGMFIFATLVHRSPSKEQ